MSSDKSISVKEAIVNDTPTFAPRNRTPQEAAKSAVDADHADAEHRQAIQDFVYLALDAEEMIPGYVQKWMFVVGMGDPMPNRLKNARLAMIEFQKIISRQGEL